ncbi:MAG: beta-L-arabinofuranosidase domain-containing protein [Planctomycetota bacterium]|jgi:DUF1680 family protein
MSVSVVCKPDTSQSNSHYVSNRQPLMANPLVKLPLGSVRPKGWIKHQLDLMVEGMTGRLEEVSHFLAPDNGWLGGKAEGWEEQAYWFRGFYAMARLTGDERCLKIAEEWIETVLATADSDGYYGPTWCKDYKSKNGKWAITDLWPHMVMNDALILHYEYTGDERVPKLLKRFLKYCERIPEKEFVPPLTRGIDVAPEFGEWKITVQIPRASDMIPQIYWLFNREGGKWLLKLATRFHQHTGEPDDNWLARHIVNFTQRFSYPGLYYQQSKRPWHLQQSEFWYRQHMDTWGQQPRGIFGADECVRDGKVDPKQGFETCGMTEFAKSFYLLGRITGDTLYAGRCEDVMLNHFPASQTPDLTGLHYLTAANLPQLDAGEKHDFFNKCEQINYSPHELYRCCQHNVAMGWPWYADNLWQASADDGLVAWMYGASEVTAKVGKSGAEVTVVEQTDYPFSGKVRLKVKTAKASGAKFPLYLRVPRWATGMKLKVAGKAVKLDAKAGGYVRIECTWTNGDVVNFEFGMELSITTWPRTGAVTVDRGPLSYSVKIGEKWTKHTTKDRWGKSNTRKWPGWEVFPTTPWNYGLVLDDDLGKCFEVVAGKGALADQPWTPDAAPIQIKAKAKQIAKWQLDKDKSVGELQVSPIKVAGAAKTITMIPLGCARLRMSVLPTIEDSPDAREWQ